MILVNVINKIFRKQKKICKVCDASVLRNHFDTVKEMVETKLDWLIVIPEGVLHEISVAKYVDKLCRIIYNYLTINSKKYSNLVVEVAEDSIRSWSVDEQGIHVVEKYCKKGYDAELLSCDREQCFRAELKKVKYNLLPVAKDSKKLNVTKKKVKPLQIITENPKKFTVPQISIEYIVLNKEKYLKFNKNLSVYDSKGRRRIGKDGYIKFETTDKFYYFEKEYIIEKIENKKVFFMTKE